MIDNVLKYPDTCIYGKVIPKITFYKFLEVSPAMKRHFQDDVVSITWLYKISPDTLQVRSSDTMKEIEIFLAELKDAECDLRLFQFIDKNISKHIVFILRREQQYKLLINYKEWADTAHTHFDITQTFQSDWVTLAQLTLPIQGNELPNIYDNFVRFIAGEKLKGESASNLSEDVLSFQHQQELEKRVAQLEQALNKETQPHRKFELHQQLISAKKELDIIWKN